MNAFTDLKPQRIEIGKIYVGVVVDNNDLRKFSKPLGRVKFRLPLLFDGIPDELLPWAVPRPARLKGGMNNGSFSVPTVGKKILIEFQSHDFYNPFYSSYPFAHDSFLEILVKQDEDRKEYPKKHLIYSFDNGNYLYLNDDYLNPSNKYKLELKNVGNARFWFGKNCDTYVEDNYLLDVNGKYVLECLPQEIRIQIKQNYKQIVEKNQSIQVIGTDTQEFRAASTHSFFAKTTRNYLNGVAIVCMQGGMSIILDSKPFGLTSAGLITVESTRDVTITGLNLTLTANNWLKLRGTKITKNVEIDFESGESTQEMIRKMVKAEVASAVARLPSSSGSSSTETRKKSSSYRV